MQTPKIGELYTGEPGLERVTVFGGFLLGMMAIYPDRFLFGIDAETRCEVDRDAGTPDWVLGVDSWAATVPNYATFLDHGAIPDTSGFYRTNLEAILRTSRGVSSTGATGSTSGTPFWSYP